MQSTLRMSQILTVTTFVILFVYGSMIIFLLVGCFYSDSANVQWELSLRRESTELQMPPAAAKTNVSARGL